MIREYHPSKQDTKSDSTEENISPSANKNHSKIRLLLVEDTEISRKVALVVLESLNCQVDIAVNGEQAINKIKNNQYDLILLDIGLPDISGTEVTKRIRTIEMESSRAPIPIIALTAHITQSNLQSYLTSGMQLVIKKPLSVSHLKTLFENWVDKKFDATDIKIDHRGLAKYTDEIFENFCHELPSHLQVLEESFQLKNWDELRNITHKIHGAASYLHLIKLKQVCNSLESVIIDNFPDFEIEILYFDLIAEINAILRRKSSLETIL